MKSFVLFAIAVFSVVFAHAEQTEIDKSDSTNDVLREFKLDRNQSNSKDSLNIAARKFWRDHEGKKLSPIETLILGRHLMKEEHWEDAKESFARICKNKRWLSREQRAESHFRYAMCLEKVGKVDEAIRINNAVLAVYSSYVEWSCQSLERGFNLSYQIEDPKKKVKAYTYLRKMIHSFKDVKELEVPSGSLTRLRKRLPVVASELELTPKQVREIDLKLGIAQNLAN